MNSLMYELLFVLLDRALVKVTKHRCLTCKTWVGIRNRLSMKLFIIQLSKITLKLCGIYMLVFRNFNGNIASSEI